MRWCVLLIALAACAEQMPSACTSCLPGRRDGLDALFADERVSAARARRSRYVVNAEAERTAAEDAEGEARDEHVMTARLSLLAAIVEQERLALGPEVAPEGVLPDDRAARLEAAREDASAIAAQSFAEAAVDEERRLAATTRDRRSNRARAAAMLATACEDAIMSASASLPAARIAELRTRLSSATAERDVDARYVALDLLAIDLREALRSLVP